MCTVPRSPGGLANRSGAGDLDVIIYSARKWARLALAGNPTVLLVLFVPDEEVVFRNAAGAELVDNAHRLGVELLSSGKVTLPIPEPDREYLRSITVPLYPVSPTVAG